MINEGATKTRRIREHGHSDLPLPPLMDPIALEARGRHRGSKAPPLEEDQLTDFQKQLEINPYARALVGPIRQCNYTRARLPVHFLQRFRAAFAPSANQPEELETSIVPNNDRIGGVIDPETGTTFSATSTYVLKSQAVVEHLQVKRRWGDLVNERMRKESDANMRVGKPSAHGRGPKWWGHDSDMSNTILFRLRENAIRALAEHAQFHGSQYIKTNGDSSQFVEDHNTHAGAETAATASNGTSSKATTSTTATAIFYDLAQLFFEGQVASLPSVVRDGSSGGSFVEIPHDKTTVKLNLALMQLEAYVRRND